MPSGVSAGNRARGEGADKQALLTRPLPQLPAPSSQWQQRIRVRDRDPMRACARFPQSLSLSRAWACPVCTRVGFTVVGAVRGRRVLCVRYVTHRDASIREFRVGELTIRRRTRMRARACGAFCIFCIRDIHARDPTPDVDCTAARPRALALAVDPLAGGGRGRRRIDASQAAVPWSPLYVLHARACVARQPSSDLTPRHRRHRRRRGRPEHATERGVRVPRDVAPSARSRPAAASLGLSLTLPRPNGRVGCAGYG